MLPNKLSISLALRYAMFYGIYGPLLGALVLFLIVMPLVYGMGEQSSVSGYFGMVLSTFVLSLWIVPIALILGIIPGFLTGAVHWLLAARTKISKLPALVRAAIISLVGGTACVVFGVGLGAAASEMLSTEIIPLFIVPGMAAGFGCALLIERRSKHAGTNH